MINSEGTGGESQCTFRFRFKYCPYCYQENDIAARQCQHYSERLIDPNDILRKSLNLKNNKVIRSAVTPDINQADKSLKITYHDEDGLTLSETFRFNYKNSRQSFNDLFARRIANGSQSIQFNSLEELERFLPYLPAPDFVIAKKKKHHWQITERLFNYEGLYRKTNELS